MNWHDLKSIAQIESLRLESNDAPVVIFKHSTRCSISKVTLDRLERSWNDSEVGNAKAYMLDLLSYRQVSDHIVNTFGIQHESPQIMVLRNGQVIYDDSHFQIDYHKVKEIIKSQK